MKLAKFDWNWEFCLNCGIWLELWNFIEILNLVKNVKFRQNGWIWAIWWNFDLILKFGLSGEISQNCEMWSALLNFAKIINYKGIVLTRLYFIERHDLLKERLYCRTGPNYPVLYKLSELSALSDSLLCPHCLYCLFYLYCPHHLHCLVIETLMKLKNLVEIAKFGQNCKISLK